MVSFDEIAEWAASLRAEQLPATVARRPRERDSVRAAIAAAWRTRSGRHWEQVTNPGHERDAGLSVLLDYDDYGFLGHPGHSAAVVAGRHEEAHVAAAELGLRLGAACLLAPRAARVGPHPRAGSGARGWPAPARCEDALARPGLRSSRPARRPGEPCSRRRRSRHASPGRRCGLRGAALAAEGVARRAASPMGSPRPASRRSRACSAASASGGSSRRSASSRGRAAPTCRRRSQRWRSSARSRATRSRASRWTAGAATLTMEALTRREDAPATSPWRRSSPWSARCGWRAYGDVNPQTLERPLPPGPSVRLRHRPEFTRDTVASIERAVPLSRGAA